MIITQAEFERRVKASFDEHTMDQDTDDEGQIIIYTGMYEWDNGSIHSEADPNFPKSFL